MSGRRRLDRDARRDRIARLAEKRRRANEPSKHTAYWDNGNVLHTSVDMDTIAVDVGLSDPEIGGDD